MIQLLSQIFEKKTRLDAFKPLPLPLAENLLQWMKIELTYASNAIEGNTLSRDETATVVEKGIAIDGKTIVEHLEAMNHAEAFDWILNQYIQRRTITQDFILNLHQLILRRIHDEYAGRYRTVPVRIAGSTAIMPNAMKIPELMTSYISWLQSTTENVVTVAAEAHLRLVSIHPFVDGNGRTARLLMNALLMAEGFPPTIIRFEDRHQYIKSLEKAQIGGSSADYFRLIYKSVDRSLDLYLHAIQGKEQLKTIEKKTLLKIGEVAKLSNETVPTIRHWTKEGLLRVCEYTASGYQLYEKKSVQTAKRVRDLQKKYRYSLKEVKEKLNTNTT